MRRKVALLVLFGLMVSAVGLILFPGRSARLAQTVAAAEEPRL